MAAEDPRDAIDWRLTTWEGARRESMRRWAELPLCEIVAALEEMESLARALAGPQQDTRLEPRSGAE